MLENSFSVPIWQKDYIEEIVILNETNEVYKYTFSNSLDNIQTVIYAKTGHSLKLENASWKINPGLSISVKNLMNSHNVNYSMTIGIRDKVNFIAINMRVGDKWFITGYDEINGLIYNWKLIELMELFIEIFNGILDI